MGGWNKGMKGYTNSGSFKKGHKCSKETIRKRKLSGVGKWNIGMKRTEESKQKMRDAKLKNPTKYWLGKKHSRGTKNKISKKLTGIIQSNETISKRRVKLIGKKRTQQTKIKMRVSAMNYLKNQYIQNGKKFTRRVGTNEKEILDALEIKLHTKIIRQHPTLGYFLDGYSKKLNIAFEVDELRRHKRIKEKDKQRQQIIEKELSCKFIRIQDY